MGQLGVRESLLSLEASSSDVFAEYSSLLTEQTFSEN